MKKIFFSFFTISILLLVSVALAQQIPMMMNYQGYIANNSSSVLINGDNYFKLAIVNTAGDTTYWSNDGTSVGGAEPTNSVTLAVIDGVYTVKIGDTSITNMTSLPITPFQNQDIYLRMWFSEDGITYEQFTPDAQLVSAGFAHRAESVSDGAVTSAAIQDHTITNSDISVSASISASKINTSGLNADNADTVDGQHASAFMPMGTDDWINESGDTMTGDLSVQGSVSIGTPTPSEMLTVAGIIESTSGGMKFPDGTIQSTSSAPFVVAQVPRSNIINTLDSAGGSMSSITIGTDGMPVISYVASNTLKVAKCGDVACTPALATINSVAPAGNYHTSIAIGTDGLPIISYLTGASLFELRVAKCSDAVCSSAIITTVDSAGNNYTSIAVGVDGLPIISYHHYPSYSLKVAKCSDIDCSSATLNTVAFGTSEYSSMAIGPDGLPVISYQMGGGWELKMAKCNNAACSATSISTVDSNFCCDLGSYTSITIGTDGFPVIAYYDATNYDLKVAKCGDVACTPALAIKNTVDSAGIVGRFTSITISTDGLPVISYHYQSSADLKVAKCSDIACSSAIISTVDSTGVVGYDTSVTIGIDGMPVISYRGSGDLKVAKCVNPFCVNNWARR